MKDAPVLHRVELALFQVASLAIRGLPTPAARAAGRWLGSLAYALAAGRRKVAIANLSAAFPDASDAQVKAWARSSFRNLGAHLLDLLSVSRLDEVELCERWTVVGVDRLRNATAGGGAILLTAHFGFWEVAGWAFGLYGGSLAIVARPFDNPHLERHVAAIRSRFGNQVLYKYGAVKGGLRQLRGGGLVGMLGDQKVRADQGAEIPFFGRPAFTSTMPARLARRCDVPILPFSGRASGRDRYRIEIFDPIVPTAQDDDASLTARCMEFFESIIREDPGLWMWMHDRWRSAAVRDAGDGGVEAGD